MSFLMQKYKRSKEIYHGSYVDTPLEREINL